MSAPNPSPMRTPDLAGLLKRPSTTPRHAEPTVVPPGDGQINDQVQPEAGDAAAGNAAARPTRARMRLQQTATGAEAAPAAARAREYLRSIMVYLPRSMHQQLRDKARNEETTATALILSAVNATHSRLGELLARAETSRHRAGSGDLFAVPQGRQSAELRTQTTIRVTDAQYRALTALTTEHHVNRSTMIVTAVREWLRP